MRTFERANLEIEANLNIDGPTVLTVSQERILALTGSADCQSMIGTLQQWYKLREEEKQKQKSVNESKRIVQIKQEPITEPESEFLANMSQTSMIPTPVMNHNQTHQQFQSKPIEVPAPRNQAMMTGRDSKPHDQFNAINNFQHQQLKVEELNELRSSPYPNFQVNPTVPQMNPSFVFTAHSPQPLANNASPPYTTSPSPIAKSPSVGSLQTANLQTMMPSPNSQPVPLREGVNGYLDASGVDLSAMMESSPQHPATLDQDEPMDTDGE